MDDLISRQVAINTLNDEYHGMISDESMKIYQIINWLNDLPPAQPETHEERTETHVCDCINCSEIPNNSDAISRQAAIDALDHMDYMPGEWAVKGLTMCKEIIKGLPSAQPERLTDDDFETIRIHLNAYKEKLCNQHRWKEADEYQRILDRFMAFASAQPDSKELSSTHKALDTISRQAAIDALRTCYDTETVTMSNGDEYINYEDAVGEIEQLPSAQPEVLACGEGELIAQPEIVRCKDCKYWNDEFAKDKSTCWLPCMSMTTHRKWYCGSAERRTDD